MEEHLKKQLEHFYNGQLNELFEEKWIKSYPEEVRGKFCMDGLVLKNKDANSGYDVNKIWKKSQRRIMFLLKDCPDKWGYDTRTLLTGYEDNEDSLKNAEDTRNLKKRFFKNLAKILYGLSYMTNDNKGQELNDEIQNKDNLVAAFNEIPFAYVECKKMAGGKSCSDKALAQSMIRDKEYFEEELTILKPNIIVCCDHKGTIFNHVVDFFNRSTLNEAEKWEGDYILDDGTNCGFQYKLYYFKEKGVLVFNAYHPTARIADWKKLEAVLSPFRKFFEHNKFEVEPKY